MGFDSPLLFPKSEWRMSIFQFFFLKCFDLPAIGRSDLCSWENRFCTDRCIYCKSWFITGQFFNTILIFLLLGCFVEMLSTNTETGYRSSTEGLVMFWLFALKCTKKIRLLICTGIFYNFFQTYRQKRMYYWHYPVP